MTKTTKAASNNAPAKKPAAQAKAKIKQPTRLDQLQGLLCRPDGASIAEMTKATGWQAHSVRGAMAGALKKRGLTITSQKIEDVRRYHGTKAA